MYNTKKLKNLNRDSKLSEPIPHEDFMKHFKDLIKIQNKRYKSWLGWFWRLHDWCWYSFWSIVRFHPINELKWFWQRGCRGWSDCDAWGACNHIARVTSEMTAYMAQRAKPGYVCGHPATLKSVKEWHAILKKISKAFKLLDEKDFYSEHLWKHHPKLARQADVMTHDEYVKTEEGWKLFKKWFHSLWD